MTFWSKVGKTQLEDLVTETLIRRQQENVGFTTADVCILFKLNRLNYFFPGNFKRTRWCVTVLFAGSSFETCLQHRNAFPRAVKSYFHCLKLLFRNVVSFSFLLKLVKVPIWTFNPAVRKSDEEINEFSIFHPKLWTIKSSSFHYDLNQSN